MQPKVPGIAARAEVRIERVSLCLSNRVFHPAVLWDNFLHIVADFLLGITSEWFSVEGGWPYG